MTTAETSGTVMLMMTLDQASAHVVYGKIPDHTLCAIYAYVEDRHSPGGFLRSVLSGNLFQAVARADSASRASLCTIVDFIYNEVPSECVGSEKAVKQWLCTPV